MISAKVLALFAALSATTLASDVYSTFYDANKNVLGSGTNFDTANGGCFNLAGAEYVAFTQGGVHGNTADGPYCLTGYSDQCKTVTGRQQFANVDVNGGTDYPLKSGVAGASAFSWAPNSC